MNKILLILGLLYLNQVNAQQNMVLNPSFEIANNIFNCSVYVSGSAIPLANWRTQTITSPDLFSATLPTTCALHPLSTNYSEQAPRTGDNYMGIYSNFASNYKEYIRGELSQPLTVGSPYTIEFYVCLGSQSLAGLATNGFGVKFLEASVPVDSNSMYYNETPDVIYSGAPITNRDQWQLITLVFTPTVPNLSEFVIGNFTDNTMSSLVLDQGFDFINYILIDDVSVTPFIPTFNLPDSICEGEDVLLSPISDNGVPGTWSPEFNNQQTTTYTFTPADTNLDLIIKTIIVKPILVPEFEQIGPFCDELPNIAALPTISKNGVEGTWSPAFNPNQTEIYTFLPDDTQCTEIFTMQVIVDETPIFDPIPPFCNYDVNFSLPTTSLNGISGTWSPAFDPYSSKTYTFTRDNGYCAQQVTMDVLVYKQFDFSLFPYCNDGEHFVEMIPFDVYVPQIVDYQWKINGNLITNQNPKLNINNYRIFLQDSNVIELTIVEDNGCVRTEKVEFIGDYLCKVQKGISPNGDGLNDFFDLISFGGVDLKIFSRYGNVVYEKSNYTNQWIGQSTNGKELPSGTYFYVIKTKIGEEFTGYIQLIK